MHCPGCGIRAAENQKFCRACGFNLEKMAQVFLEQLTQENADLPAELRRTERLVGGGIFVLLMSLLLTAASSIVYWIILVRGQVWQGLAGLGALAWFSLLMYFVGKWNDLQEIKKERRQARPIPAVSAPDTNQLLSESSQEPISGIAEHTTRSLDRV